MPAWVVYPFGFKIRVRYLTAAQLAQVGGRKGCAGLWDYNLKTIYVLNEDPLHEQIETLGHEMQHACTDFRTWLEIKLRMPLAAATAELEEANTEDD